MLDVSTWKMTQIHMITWSVQTSPSLFALLFIYSSILCFPELYLYIYCVYVKVVFTVYSSCHKLLIDSLLVAPC